MQNQNYCLYLKIDENDEMKSVIRNKILIAAFKQPLVEVILMFLHAALPPLINLNLLLERSGQLIRIFYDALFTCVKQLLSKFASPELERKLLMAM